jgi:iron(III) transport system permease protein
VKRGAVIASVMVGIALLGTVLPLVGVLMIAVDPPQSGFAPEATPNFSGILWREGESGGSWGPLPRTLLLALLVCLGAGGLGMALAWLSERAEYPGRRWLCRLGLMPFALPSYLLAMTAREFFGSQSFNGLLAATAVLILATSPYAQLLLSASLARIGGGAEEAARSLGAGPAEVFRRILVPRLRPALAYALLLVLLYTVSDFGVVDILDCEVLTWSLYQNFNQGLLGLAAMEGLGLVVLVMPLILLARRLHGRSRPEGLGSQARRPQRLRLASRGRACAYALHALQIGAGLALPFYVMLNWIFPAALRDESWDFGAFELLGLPLIVSLGFALIGTAVAIALAAAPAWRAARRSGDRDARGRPQNSGGLVELLIHAAQALPGVLVAFGVLMCARELALGSGRAALYDGLRQSGTLIVLGLGLRFLGQVFGSLKTAILRLDRRQEEAARSLGAGALRIARRVQLPALLPGLSAAALLAILGIVKELPVTLMLRPRDFSPLSYRLYGRYQEGNYLEAGLVGLVMAGLALTLSALARRVERSEEGTAPRRTP